MFEFENFRRQCLTQRKDSTPTKFSEVYSFGYFFAHFIVGFNLLRLGQGNLFIFVFHFSIGHNHAVAIDFEVAFVGVYDNVEVFIATEDACKHVAKTFFQHAHQGHTVDVLGVFKLLERVDHAQDILIFFSCYHRVYYRLMWSCPNIANCLHALMVFPRFNSMGRAN